MFEVQIKSEKSGDQWFSLYLPQNSQADAVALMRREMRAYSNGYGPRAVQMFRVVNSETQKSVTHPVGALRA